MIITNLKFPIYSDDQGTSFHGLELKKATFESSAMSLGDKISGDVYHNSQTLDFTMATNVVYDGTRYYLLSPPTMVKEGMVSENSDLMGMTKYSLEFYHPMVQISNLPFSDVAVSDDEKVYLSESRTFSWIGYLADFINKINKNFQNTIWKVSTALPSSFTDKLSEVLSFDKNMVSDALKKAYEVWELPFTIRKIESSESDYADGKRFMIHFGLPTDTIKVSGDDFVFRYGQHFGLKNNSRTPKNNKIITRIVGYGSEDNVPFGYPQIPWYGDHGRSFTYGNRAGVFTNVTIGEKTFAKLISYPIYKGIVDGEYVELIKHPFTRSHLMPNIYVQSLFNKVSFLDVNEDPNEYYDPDIELKDYYDATAQEGYPNPINTNAPSVEIHSFDDVKPEMGDAKIVSVLPFDDNEEKYMSWAAMIADIDAKISNAHDTSNTYEETNLTAFQTVISGNTDSGEASGRDQEHGGSAYFHYSFQKTDGRYIHAEYNSPWNTLSYDAFLQNATPTNIWVDDMDEEGNYIQSYFKLTLPTLSFDLYACAAITQEMNIVMRGGACLGCTFPIQVDWDDYKKNFYDANGNFDPSGSQRDLTKYPNSNNTQVTVIVKKDNTTFGTLMPNIYQQPKGDTSVGQNDGDAFVITGISLPESYITSAQTRLDSKMKSFMLENNEHKFDYPFKLDEHFLATNTDIASQIEPNKKLIVDYLGTNINLYIQKMSVKYGDSPLPKVDVTLSDNIEVVLNQIGSLSEQVSRISEDVSNVEKNVSSTSVSYVEGERGEMGRNYYYYGSWEDFVLDNTKTFKVTDAEAPYFDVVKVVNGVPTKEFYVFVGENGEYGTTVDAPSDNSPLWEKMETKFKYLIAEALFSNFASLGSWIFNDDYMYSKVGYAIIGGDETQVSFDNGYRFFGENNPDNTYTPSTYFNARTGYIYSRIVKFEKGGTVGGFNIGENYIGGYYAPLFQGLKMFSDGRIQVGYMGSQTQGGHLLYSLIVSGGIELIGNGENIIINTSAGSAEQHGTTYIIGYTDIKATNGYLKITDLPTGSNGITEANRIYKDSNGFLKIT